MPSASIFVRPPSPPPRVPSPIPDPTSLPPPRRPRLPHLKIHHARSMDSGLGILGEEKVGKMARDPAVGRSVSKGILKPSPPPTLRTYSLPAPILTHRSSRTSLSNAIPYKSPPPSPAVTSPPPVPPIPAFAFDKAYSPSPSPSPSPLATTFPSSPRSTTQSIPRKTLSVSVTSRRASSLPGELKSPTHRKKTMSTQWGP
ncbi:hypothetical protein Moror_8039 [Moniliophthora roreri MCA 2997]|uniref:Uncharacterized protein n=1 Tax=Moniliophthora roreri (strain MCA 2997) TaxID=1381753 RepID=V2XNQ9_MONRO|nr:hypothetical protein Moror_8039 [Moniliophthora roreri MCA 2997]